MSKSIFIFCLAVMSVASVASAQKPYEKPKMFIMKSFLTVDQMPDATKYLPAPPDENSLYFTNDVLRYQWGKTIRGTERGKQAAKDADYSTEYLMEYFAPAFGIHVTKEDTPELWKCISLAIGDGSNSIRKAKKAYMRKRPYVYFNEPTSVPEDEEVLRKTGSFPSGHTSRGWMCALLMVEINPENQDEILNAGYEYGQSRVITGFHYQSDVDAARMAISGAFARLHADKSFVKQIERAKKEFEKLYKKKAMPLRPGVEREEPRDAA